MSPSISKADVAMLGRRRAQPVKAPGELLAVFVGGAISNPMNATWGWRKRRTWASEWKDHVETALLESGGRSGPRVQGRSEWFSFSQPNRAPYGLSSSVPAAALKRVAFTASVFNRLDGDGLQAALKPIRDALVECGVISGDADRDGHVFVYEQQIDRTNRGVTIRVSLHP